MKLQLLALALASACLVLGMAMNEVVPSLDLSPGPLHVYSPTGSSLAIFERTGSDDARLDINGQAGRINFDISGTTALHIRFDEQGTLILRAKTDGLEIPSSLSIGKSTVSNGSAVLELYSMDRGFLPPRMTTAQRDVIQNPVEGLMIYNLMAGRLEVYGGSEWCPVSKQICK